MNYSTAPRSLALIIMAILITACATASKPIGEWRSETFSGQVNNILIIGVTARSTRRRVFEDMFVDQLKAANVDAVPSYTLLESSLQLTRDIVVRAIKGQNLGAVLVTRLVGIKDEEVYKLPASYDDDRGFIGYYDHAWQETSTGYYSQYRIFTLETTLYDTATEQLIWSMQSEAIDASQPREIIEAQIALAIDSISNQGLIVTKP